MSEKAYVIMVNDTPVEIVLGDEESAQTRREELRVKDLNRYTLHHGDRPATQTTYGNLYRWHERKVDLTVFRTALAYQIDAVRSAEGRILEILQELNRATGLQVVDVDLRYPNHPRPECPEILGVRVSCELDFRR